jgi:8-oxo-dGTP pyrophosphatase MutT (NUDIX family)
MPTVRARLADLPSPLPSPIDHDDPREAAVLVPLVERDGEVHIVFTKRPDAMKHHAGEISFPGGSREAADADLVATALRETHEEIGLEPSRVEVIAQLDTMATIASNFVISPYVGVVEELGELVADPIEVERILVVPLSELLAPETYREEHWDMRVVRPEWAKRAVHFFELPAAPYTHGEGETIWGATARILVTLCAHITGTRLDTPPALG